MAERRREQVVVVRPRSRRPAGMEMSSLHQVLVLPWHARRQPAVRVVAFGAQAQEPISARLVLLSSQLRSLLQVRANTRRQTRASPVLQAERSPSCLW